MSMPFTLIKNLCESNADNDAETLVLAIRTLGDKHGLSLEIQQDIADLACEFRKQAIQNAMESAMICVREILDRAGVQ